MEKDQEQKESELEEKDEDQEQKEEELEEKEEELEEKEVELEEKEVEQRSFFVYLLQSSDGATYVGATVNLDRRLRQHNKEIKGGATATGIRVARGESWQRICYVQGFPTWQAALQFEWRFKSLGRKKQILACRSPLARRMQSLKQLLALPQSTSKAVPYAQWPTQPSIVWESEEAKQLFHTL